MFCPNCGKENSPFAQFCENCGSNISEAMTDNSEMQQNNEPTQPMYYTQQQTDYPQQQAQPISYNQQNQTEEYNPQPGIGSETQASRYQEYNMGDVIAQKKSHKKLIITLIVITSVILLAVAGFFIFRFIKKSMTISKIKEQPAAFLATAYQATSEAFCSQDEILNMIVNNSKQKTVKTTVNMGDLGKQSTMYSIDGDNKKIYGKVEISADQNNISAEFYSNLDRHVLKASNGSDSFDFYVDSKDLRTNAANSAFAPNNQDGFGIDQKTYDTFMDVYEYAYNNLSKDGDDAFALKALGERICADIDKCGNVEVKEDKADIYGQNTDCIVITHSFKDTSIIDALYVDIKDWANTNININQEINDAVKKALEDMDPMKYKSYLGSANFDVTIHHFINKDNSKIMKAEISITAEGKTVVLSATFGIDPATSNKITLDISAMGINQTITLERQSDSSQDKYNINFSGIALLGDVTITRNKSTGEVNFNTTVSSPFSSGTGTLSNTKMMMTSDVEPVPNTGYSLSNPSVSMNDLSNYTITIKKEGNAAVFKLVQKNDPNTSIEYSISNEPEIVELTSENDILKASRDQIVNSINKVFVSSQLTVPSNAIDF